tara:strand:- start:2071 stop:2325 length:255 start_codon:yes stop_codon:yes gene_type:complete
MDNQTIQETARETLARIREESINLGNSVYSDFVSIAHNEFEDLVIDFSNYGYLEYCLFADALKLFENNGYDQITQLIDELEDSE